MINVVTAYEDFATGKRAIETYSNLVLRLGHEFQFRANMWKFDVLQHPKLQAMAASDALEAQLIIISTHGGEDLPGGVKDWISHWVCPKGKKGRALVALFDPVDGEDIARGPVRSYLRQIAQAGRMDFFSQPAELPGEGPAGSSSRTRRTARAALLLDAILRQEETGAR